MALLGHVLERKTGQSFETLVVERICRPLHMDSTRMKLTPELQARFARPHGEKGEAVENYELTDFAGAGGLRSSANDLLKYVAANLALQKSPELTPLMQKMQVIRHQGHELNWGNTAMPWMDQCVFNPPGSQLIGHAGGTDGYSVFIGLDLQQHRGIVVMTNQKAIRPTGIGWRIMQRAPLAGLDPTAMMGIRNVIGVGVALGLDKKTGALRIIDILPNSPAAQAGLAKGLIVQSIDGVAPKSKSIEQCAELIRGAEGTVVRLALADPEGKESSLELTRSKFEMDK
jgi:CubicO group peptidase (beta-lactamase class C family)